MLGDADFHVHLDRARTYRHNYVNPRAVLEDLATISLRRKQSAVGILHEGLAYENDELESRMDGVLTEKFAAGETSVNAVIDVTADVVGLRAFEIGLKLREKYENKVNIGAYPIFGFESRDSDRHRIIQEATKKAQFLMGLPERDEGKPIGYDGHLQILFELGHRHSLPIHVHVDQSNDSKEIGTRTLIEATRWFGSPKVEGETGPTVWAVHVISPSAYEDDRFWPLAYELKKYNIGVIVCPHAALSMRQHPNQMTPGHNSIARIWEFCALGIEVRLGTDNVDDIFMPRPKSCLLEREIDLLASATRFYDEAIIAKLRRGESLNEIDRSSLEKYLPRSQ